MFSPPLKKSIVFLKYALKMDLVKGAWFDLYNYMGRPTQYSVSLSQEEKEKLLAMSKDNKLSARVSKSVLILLALDNKTNSDIVD